MYRTKTNSYYSLLFASLLAATACGDEDSDTDVPAEEEMQEPVDGGVAADATVSDAAGGKADAATTRDAAMASQDAAPATPDASSSGDASTTTDATFVPPSGNFEHGETLAADLVCASCHRANFAGFGFYPNITPDNATGVGGWTDQQLADAITKGKAKDGTNLCATMARFDLSEGEVADLIAYIRGIPAVSKTNTGSCD